MKKVHIETMKKIFQENSLYVSDSFFQALKNEEERDLLFSSFMIEKRISDNKYYFKIKDKYREYIKTFIEKNTLPESTNRQELAEYNLTHNLSTVSSIIEIIQYDILHVKVFSEDKATSNIKEILKNPSDNFKQNKIALIIENMDNFIGYKNILNKLSLKEKHNIEDIDIIFGKGFNILNPKNKEFLNGYEIIYTFFDLDYYGYLMYLSLKDTFNEKIQNVYVKNIEDYFKKIKEKKEFPNIWNFIQRKEKFLTKEDIKVLRLIQQYGSIEQEIFLGEI